LGYALAMGEDDLVAKALLVLAGAVLGFLSNLAIDVLRRRREIKRRLTYSLEHSPIALEVRDESVAKRLELTYNGRPVSRIHVVKCNLRNAGTELIQDQFVRFEFSDGAIIDSGFEKTPEPELQARHQADSETWSHGSSHSAIQYCFGHLNPGDDVFIYMLVETENYIPPRVKQYNKLGSPTLIEISAQREQSERSRALSLFRSVTLLAAAAAAVEAIDFIDLGFSPLLLSFAFYLTARESELVFSIILPPRGQRSRDNSGVTVGEIFGGAHIINYGASAAVSRTAAKAK